jgi:hypothetical protein
VLSYLSANGATFDWRGASYLFFVTSHWEVLGYGTDESKGLDWAVTCEPLYYHPSPRGPCVHLVEVSAEILLSLFENPIHPRRYRYLHTEVTDIGKSTSR